MLKVTGPAIGNPNIIPVKIGLGDGKSADALVRLSDGRIVGSAEPSFIDQRTEIAPGVVKTTAVHVNLETLRKAVEKAGVKHV